MFLTVDLANSGGDHTPYIFAYVGMIRSIIACITRVNSSALGFIKY